MVLVEGGDEHFNYESRVCCSVPRVHELGYPTQNEEIRYLQSLISIWCIFTGFGILFSTGASAAHRLVQLLVDVI